MTASDPITVNYMNELRDHVEAQRVLYRESVLFKTDKVVAVLLLALGIWEVWAVGWLWWTIIWFPLAVIVWSNLLRSESLIARVQFRRNPKYREEYHLTFSRENIHFRTASIDSTLQWSLYERLIESRTLFLLMHGKGLYTLVPKRCFHAEDELNAFRELVRERIPQWPQL